VKVVEEDPRALFVRRWGEMAASWGVGRTLAEIHALLYLAQQPLCTDDVIDQLSVSRGSASTNLRELVNWGLIHRVHQRGDRKEYFVAETAVWSMFETITRERRRREVEPIVETIQRCLAILNERPEAEGMHDKQDADNCRARLADMLEFFMLMNGAFNMLIGAGPDGLRQMVPPGAGAPGMPR